MTIGTNARTGPSPLWLHLNGTAAMMVSASEDKRMHDASQDILNEAMVGVKAYHDSDVQPFIREMTVVAEYKRSRLITAKEWGGGAPVILIPSLINGWQIFDIEKDHSFCAYLSSQGLTPYVVDWAQPSDVLITIDDYIADHLPTLLAQLKTPPRAMIGYCMGATFLPGFLPHYDHDPAIVMIAPPWDFSYQTPDQMMRIQSLAMQTYMMGNTAPDDFVQSLFWAVDPLQVIKKFRKFPSVNNLDRFVRVEDWLNAGHKVSRSILQTCLFDWYRDNKIMKDEWIVNGCAVTDQSLPEKTLIMSGAADGLVPPQSVQPLIKNRTHISVNTGHIGLMASDKAVDQVWKPVAEFIHS